jgi:hypothetical protein
MRKIKDTKKILKEDGEAKILYKGAKLRITSDWSGTVAHSYNPSYSEDGYWDNHG